MEFVVIWVASVAFGIMLLAPANKKVLGFLLGFLLGPIGVGVAIIMRMNAKLAQPTSAKATAPQEIARRAERDCPYCAERVLIRANICKHCGKSI